jgi:hypothetical protein
MILLSFATKKSAVRTKTRCGNECYMLSGQMHCFLISCFYDWRKFFILRRSLSVPTLLLLCVYLDDVWAFSDLWTLAAMCDYMHLRAMLQFDGHIHTRTQHDINSLTQLIDPSMYRAFGRHRLRSHAIIQSLLICMLRAYSLPGSFVRSFYSCNLQRRTVLLLQQLLHPRFGRKRVSEWVSKVKESKTMLCTGVYLAIISHFSGF